MRLPKGTRLTTQEGLRGALRAKEWTSLQQALLSERFDCLQQSEKGRKHLEKIMIKELLDRPQWCKLWRMMGVRHMVALGRMAIIGDVNRFPNAKKLVGYIGLSPSKVQSGNNVKGREKGTGNTGRGDVRALFVQSAQNALNYRESALHKWGWKLALKKHRKLAVAAVARKLVTAIWHLLKVPLYSAFRDDKTVTTKAFGYCRYTRKGDAQRHGL